MAEVGTVDIAMGGTGTEDMAMADGTADKALASILAD
jgi:hypothetical protein